MKKLVTLLLVLAMVFNMTIMASATEAHTVHTVEEWEHSRTYKSVGANEYGDITFETFADLKELASRTYDDQAHAIYVGSAELVISENIVIPEKLHLDFRDASVKIQKGITCTLNARFYAMNMTVDGSLVISEDVYFCVTNNFTITGAVTNYGTIELEDGATMVGFEKITLAGPYSSIQKNIYVHTEADVYKALNHAPTDKSGIEYTIYVNFGSKATLNSDFTVPANTMLICWDEMVINGTCTVKGCLSAYASIVVNGELINNGTKLFNNGSVYLSYATLTFGRGASYSGNSKISCYGIKLEETFAGINLDDFKIELWGNCYNLTYVGDKIKLGSATDLTWGVLHGQVWDSESGKMVDYPAKDTVLPGVASFKRATFDLAYYTILLYKVGKETAIGGGTWPANDCSWYDTYFVDSINESGDYYFTVTARGDLGDSTEYADGPTVKSDVWTYVKPTKALETPYQLTWDWPYATFNIGDDESKISGTAILFYYTDVLGGTPQYVGGMTARMATDKVEISNQNLMRYGSGYYTFEVRALSGDLNTVANSEWSEMSPAYYYYECQTHNWTNATCTEPKTCSVCKTTEGEAKGHSWTEATCTEPKTCSICQATEGASNGHKWSDATCTEPKTCSVCKVTEGNAKGHSWTDATCTEAKTCTVCKATEGDPIPHVFDQEKAEPKYLVSEGVYYKSCKCGAAGTETFTVKEEKPEEKPVEFKDVPQNAYYHSPVMWAVENKVTSGTGDGTTFEPNAVCTRGQVVTFLWRAAGQPEPKNTDNPFKDVKTSDYFYKAVLWALENKITTGTGDGTTFEPHANCNRGQIVTFLSRAKNGKATNSDNPFVDVASNAYYYNPVLWAVENGITTGTGDGTTFEPNADCTRGQVITFLYRAYTK